MSRLILKIESPSGEITLGMCEADKDGKEHPGMIVSIPDAGRATVIMGLRFEEAKALAVALLDRVEVESAKADEARRKGG